MWAIVNRFSKVVERLFATEDEAWSYIMRLELNYIPGAHELEVREIDDPSAPA